METFREKVVAVYFEAEATLNHLIYQHGKESEVNSKKCLPLSDDFQDNIDGTYLVEVNEEYFVSDDGQQYSYDCISMDRFCEIVDDLKETFGE